MTAPLGYSHRHDPGLVGMLARAWLRYRTVRVRAALQRAHGR